MKITPQYICTFETNVQTLVLDSWARVAKDLFWDKFMDVKTSGTLRELFFWLVETAGIYPEGQGGNKRYDDIAAMFREIDNENSGAALELTKNEIEDNMMAGAGLRGMPALDYSANWARQVGGAAAYWPQQKLFELLAAAETEVGYDGVPFFSAAHPINPATGAGGTWSNLLTAKPLGGVTVDVAAANLVAGIAAMRSVKMPNGKFRRLRPKWLLHDPSITVAVNTLLGAKFFGAQGSTENVITQMGIEPVCADELAVEPGAWYLGAEILPAEGGPFIFQNREAYTLTSYTSDSQVELQRRKKFEWIFDGRNAAAYGHPYTIFKFKPA
jgi:phage major head subunit gpT-like protein